MSKKIFTEQEILELSKNKYVMNEDNDLKSKEIILKAFNFRRYKKGLRSNQLLAVS